MLTKEGFGKFRLISMINKGRNPFMSLDKEGPFQIFQKIGFLPQVQELCQSEQFELDRHNHTCRHLKHCRPQYLVDNQHPDKWNMHVLEDTTKEEMK